VNSNGLICGVGVGTATVSATIGGLTAVSGPITVTPQYLQNRYSFVSDATDSVGGADGMIVAPNGGNPATITNGLILPGNTTGGFGVAGYVALPAGLLTNTTSLTVECWFTQNQGNGWAEVWDFGNNGSQNFALIPFPENNNGKMEVAFTPNGGEIDLQSTYLFPNGVEQYVAVTYNNYSLVANLYDNGALLASRTYPSTSYAPGSIGGAAGTVQNMLGNDVYGDQQFNGTIYELRIWNGAVPPAYLAASAAAGSSVLVTNTIPLSINVSAGTSLVVGQTESAAVTGNFAQVSGVSLTVAVSAWTSSNPAVLTVDSNGVVTAVSPGTATVSATVAGVTATSSTVTVSPNTISIAQSGSNIVLGWLAGTAVLLEAPSLNGPWTTNTTAIPPYQIAPAATGNQFFRLLLNP
jgi:hypothetical protein